MNPESSFWLPPAKSTLAPGVDGLYNFLVWASVVMFIVICGAAGYWVYKYRRKAGDENELSKAPLHSIAIEVFWSVGPLVACIGLFHWGVKDYLSMRVAPAGSEEIQVRGRKWAWEFQYSNGAVKDKLFVPVNRPVKLIMQSQDVIHSFYVPEFRVKQDVLPGRYSTLWFQATAVGEAQVFCTEYCGNSHSDMLTKVVVLDDKAYKDEIDDDGTMIKAADGSKKPRPPLEIGKLLYESKQCNTCHTLDGSPKIGPSFKGLFGKMETLADGSTVKVDENYLRESVLVPNAKVVKGYQPVMPAFQGSLNDKQIDGIIAFIKAQQ